MDRTDQCLNILESVTYLLKKLLSKEDGHLFKQKKDDTFGWLTRSIFSRNLAKMIFMISRTSHFFVKNFNVEVDEIDH